MDLIFDHVGLVVPTIELGRENLRRLFGIVAWTEVFRDPVQRVFVQFGRDRSGICYELIAPDGVDSKIAGALGRREILNHLAYKTPNLAATMLALRSQGYMPLTDAAPAVAFGNAQITFMLTPLRFIIELIEQTEHRHEYIIHSDE